MDNCRSQPQILRFCFAPPSLSISVACVIYSTLRGWIERRWDETNGGEHSDQRFWPLLSRPDWNEEDWVSCWKYLVLAFSSNSSSKNIVLCHCLFYRKRILLFFLAKRLWANISGINQSLSPYLWLNHVESLVGGRYQERSHATLIGILIRTIL